MRPAFPDENENDVDELILPLTRPLFSLQSSTEGNLIPGYRNRNLRVCLTPIVYYHVYFCSLSARAKEIPGNWNERGSARILRASASESSRRRRKCTENGASVSNIRLEIPVISCRSCRTCAGRKAGLRTQIACKQNDLALDMHAFRHIAPQPVCCHPLALAVPG